MVCFLAFAHSQAIAHLCEDIVLHNDDSESLRTNVLRSLNVKLDELAVSTSPDLSNDYAKFVVEVSDGVDLAKRQHGVLKSELIRLETALQQDEQTYKEKFNPGSKVLSFFNLSSHSQDVRARKSAIYELQNRVSTREWFHKQMVDMSVRAEDLGIILNFSKYMRDADTVFSDVSRRSQSFGIATVAVRELVGSGKEIAKSVEELGALIALVSRHEYEPSTRAHVAIFLYEHGKNTEADILNFFKTVAELKESVKRSVALRFAILFEKYRILVSDRDAWIKLFLEMVKGFPSEAMEEDLLYSISHAMEQQGSPQEVKELSKFIRECHELEGLSYRGATMLANAFFWDKNFSDLRSAASVARANFEYFYKTLKVASEGSYILAAGLTRIRGNSQDREELLRLYKRFFRIQGVTEEQAASIAVAIKIKDAFGAGPDPLMSIYFHDYQAPRRRSSYGSTGGFDGNMTTPW